MAQRDIAGFKSTKDSRFADNTSGQIEEVDHRDMYEDTADSFLNITDHLQDDDTFASASATKVASSESTKAYVDAQVAGATALVEKYSRIFEDFTMAPTGVMLTSAFNNGGGLGATVTTSTVGLDSTEKAIGVLAFGTGSSTAGGSGLTNVTYKFPFGNGFTCSLEYRAAISALSDGTDTYEIRVGFMDATGTAPANGAYFRYKHSVNSGKWQAVTVSASTETAEDTGITAEISVFHLFKVIGNAAGTQIDFYVDGVKTNDITTNIPTSGTAVGQVAVIEKTAGSTNRILYLDYYEFITERTTAR